MKLLYISIIPVLLLTACIKDKTPSSNTETTIVTNKEEYKPVNNDNVIVQESIATGKNSIAVNSLENTPQESTHIVQKAVATGKNSTAMNSGGNITLK